MAEKHKPTFDKYVNFACHILWTERRNWGDTFEDFALECYRRETAKRRKVFLRNLICGSEHLQIIRDVVNRIGQAELGKSRRAPPELEIWMAKTAVLKRPVLTARGRNPNTNLMRNRAIMIAVSRLANRPDMTATRNESRGKDCSFKGGSACDAVGLALRRVYKKLAFTKPDYKTIERIWFEYESLGSHLESPTPFFLKFHFRYRLNRLPRVRLSDPKTRKPR